MTKLLVISFLIAHGFVHAALYDVPPDPKHPNAFNPGDSWMLKRMGVAAAEARRTSVVLATSTALLYSLAGLGLLLDTVWWRAGTIVATALAASLKIAYFQKWLVLGVALDLGIVLALAVHWPGSLY